MGDFNPYTGKEGPFKNVDVVADEFVNRAGDVVF
jgi:hypothetical protein